MINNQFSYWYTGQEVSQSNMQSYSQDMYQRLGQVTQMELASNQGLILYVNGITQGSGNVVLGDGAFRFTDTTISYLPYQNPIFGYAAGATVSVSGNGYIVARYTVSPNTTLQTNYTFSCTYVFTTSIVAATDVIVCVITGGNVTGYGVFYGTPSINDQPNALVLRPTTELFIITPLTSFNGATFDINNTTFNINPVTTNITGALNITSVINTTGPITANNTGAPVIIATTDSGGAIRAISAFGDRPLSVEATSGGTGLRFYNGNGALAAMPIRGYNGSGEGIGLLFGGAGANPHVYAEWNSTQLATLGDFTQSPANVLYQNQFVNSISGTSSNNIIFGTDGSSLVQIGHQTYNGGDGSTGTVVDFNEAFPNQCQGIICTDIGSGANRIGAVAISATQFRVWAKGDGDAYDTTDFQFIAWGN